MEGGASVGGDGDICCDEEVEEDDGVKAEEDVEMEDSLARLSSVLLYRWTRDRVRGNVSGPE